MSTAVYVVVAEYSPENGEWSRDGWWIEVRMVNIEDRR